MSTPQAQLRQALSEVWGFQSFRAGQEPVLKAWAEGRDVLALLPTGAGKSLCYQLPAVVLRQTTGAMTIVVSPLIALMADQVRALRAIGVRAAALNSQIDPGEQQDIEDAADAGLVDILYVSPERTMQPRFRRLVSELDVGLIAIDEAHCLSQWGHDFRPEYMQLEALRRAVEAPVLAVTATATPRVVDEILTSLTMSDAEVVRGDFARPNLRFSVVCESSQQKRMSRLVAELRAREIGRQANSGRAIVYCASRRRVDSATAELRHAGISAAPYHAGKSQTEREKAQRAFELGRVKVLVATNAFGMGVDFPDVRLVAHLQAPGSVEAYYQEAGRAGRDGQPADCLLFFSAADAVLQRRFAKTAAEHTRTNAALRALEGYVDSSQCRQVVLCEHFAAQVGEWTCEICDVCAPSSAQEQQAAELAAETALLDGASLDKIVEAVGNLRKPVGKVRLAQALRGSRAKALSRYGLLDLPQHGALAGVHQRTLCAAIEQLLADGRLARRGQKYPTVWLPGKAVRNTPSQSGSQPRKTPRRRRTTAERTNLLRALELYRRRTAKKLGWKPYMVIHNKVIQQLDQKRPGSLHELQTIDGLGPAKIDRFGFELLDIVRRYDEERRG